MSNTLQDIVLTMFRDECTYARTNRTKPISLRPYYGGRGTKTRCHIIVIFGHQPWISHLLPHHTTTTSWSVWSFHLAPLSMERYVSAFYLLVSLIIITADHKACHQSYGQLSCSSPQPRTRKKQKEYRDQFRVPCAPGRTTLGYTHSDLHTYKHTYTERSKKEEPRF